MTGYIVELNNYLQKSNQMEALVWDQEQIGPPGRKVWKVTCNIHSEAKGVGISTVNDVAKELAAKDALANLGYLKKT